MIPVPELLRVKLADVPEKPGCYIYRDANGRIIYVGKAVSLRRRVLSYFRESSLRRGSPKLRGLVRCIADVEWITVRSEAEALLTESRLIKENKPRFNIAMTDDKRYLALRGEIGLEFPRFSEHRIVRDDGDLYFGPFPSATVVRTVKDFMERRWGLRKCDFARPGEAEHRHCHDDRIARCSAPCIGAISREEYRARFDEACAFLRNGDRAVIAELGAEMRAAAAAQDFEGAARMRDTIAALRDMVRLRAKEVLEPKPGRGAASEGCRELGELLRLPGPPHVIEGFDISHLGGLMTVASMVACVDGVTTPQRYRRFKIKTVEGIDDPRGMAEVVTRRYMRLRAENGAFPDLVMVDGGITQLRAARAALAAAGFGGLPVVGLAERFEIIVVDWPDGTGEIVLPRESEALKVLIRLRDEAHRFAISYNRMLRRRRIRESALDEIEGVGATRKRELLKRFGSVRRIAAAPVREIASVAGVGAALAEEIRKKLARFC